MRKVIVRNQKLAEWIHLGIIYDGIGNITVYTGKDEKKLWRKLKKQKEYENKNRNYRN